MLPPPMPTLTCEACGINFTVLRAGVGDKFSCPHCGDVNLIRPPAPPLTPAAEAIANSQPASPQAAAPAATASAAAGAGPERDVLVVHPAMFRARPAAFTGLCLLIIVSLVGAWWLSNNSAAWTANAALVVALAAVVTLGVWKVCTLGERLTITSKRVRFRRGLLGRVSKEMLHRTIQDIHIEQTFLQRMLKAGTIRIANSGEDGDEIKMANCPDPAGIQRAIDSFRPM